MEVAWIATEADSWRYGPDEVTSPLEDLRAHVRALRARGKGYVEIAKPGSDYPALLVGFEGELAVVHLQQDAETMILLHGDGSVPAEKQAHVWIVDDAATFPGRFVMTLNRALHLMEEFVHSGSVGDHPRTRMS